MSATLINLIIQLIAGAVGGNAAGAAVKNVDLGTLGNTIAGAIGGAGGGTLLTALLPILFKARPAASISANWLGRRLVAASRALSSAPSSVSSRMR
jgi:uncharacterized membrane protein YeaQ/YmgE (transglycosylase-associated protein family)